MMDSGRRDPPGLWRGGGGSGSEGIAVSHLQEAALSEAN